MAKKVTGLDSPAKRARLLPGKNPYWVSVGGSRAGEWLGYRRPRDGAGTWVAKVIVDKRKAEARLAQADDAGHAPDALDYSAAVSAALAWAKARRAAIAAEALGAQAQPEAEATVRGVVESYIAARVARATRGKDAEYRLTKHVLGDAKLAGLPLSKVSAAALGAWRGRLPRHSAASPAQGRIPVPEAPTMARGTSKTGKADVVGAAGKKRSQRGMTAASVNRLLNDFRAALATAYPGGVLPGDLRSKLKGEADATEAREVKTLPATSIVKLGNAATQVNEHFGRLVLVLAATGTRFSQAARITVADVQVAAERIMVPASAKGRATKARKPTAVPVGADVLARLKPILDGRAGSDVLLTQPNGEPWTFPAQMTRPWRTARTAAGLPPETVPYDLRHSSIVRMLAAGVAIRFVAMTHDTSVAMIEQHYSRFITSEVEAAARGAIVPLTSAPITQLRAVS